MKKTIGIDLTPIQGPHRMRGVGSVVVNFIRHIPLTERKSNHFVFYLYDNDIEEALRLAGIDDSFTYSLRMVTKQESLPPSIKTLKGMIYVPLRILRAAKIYLYGSDRLGDVGGLDVLLQFEQDVSPPPPKKIPTVVIAYDLIPYILESDYLWSYKTARQNHHYSRRGALLAQLRRSRYLMGIKRVMHLAHKIIAISEHTRNDFIRLAGVPADKIETVHLGVAELKEDKGNSSAFGTVDRYVASFWGDVKISSDLPRRPFLLFVGGADPRRKLADLIAAFNLLRAQEKDVRLVLAGDTMLGPNSIPNHEAAQAIQSSSYKDDIYFLGFVSDEVREWLYRNALAFVYPTLYEGFGLPILEAMRYGTPVITYENSSVKEISGDAALYAERFTEIAELSAKLLSDKSKLRNDIKRRGIAHVDKFSWSSAAKKMLASLQS
ncbi:MAG: glycosyltransferase family 4 protein [Candidatus Saccharimonadales bacterium]